MVLIRIDTYNAEGLVLVDRLIEWIWEPLFEVLLTAEDLGHQEMHERPELHHIILKGCPSKKEPSLGVEPE